MRGSLVKRIIVWLIVCFAFFGTATLIDRGIRWYMKPDFVEIPFSDRQAVRIKKAFGNPGVRLTAEQSQEVFRKAGVDESLPDPTATLYRTIGYAGDLERAAKRARQITVYLVIPLMLVPFVRRTGRAGWSVVWAAVPIIAPFFVVLALWRAVNVRRAGHPVIWGRAHPGL